MNKNYKLQYIALCNFKMAKSTKGTPFMNQAFKEWLIEMTEEFPPETKQKFLHDLKFAPGRIERELAGRAYYLEVSCSLSTKTAADFKPRHVPELLQALQEHFAPETAAIAQ